MKKIIILITFIIIVFILTGCMDNKIKITSIEGKWEGTLLINGEIQKITGTITKGDNNYRGYLNIDNLQNDSYYFCYCQKSSVILETSDFKTKFTGQVHMDNKAKTIRITGNAEESSWELTKSND